MEATTEMEHLQKRVKGAVKRRESKEDTEANKTRRESREAAMRYRQALMEAICETILHMGPSTADEIADLLEESVLSVRPRVSELYKDFDILIPTGEKRRNRSGRNAVVWTVKPQ